MEEKGLDFTTETASKVKQALCTIAGICMALLQVGAQSYRVYGKVLSEELNEPLSATVFVQSINVLAETDSNGYFEIQLPAGKHVLEVFSLGMGAELIPVVIDRPVEVNFFLSPYTRNLDEVEVEGGRTPSNGIARLRSIDGFGIYEAKKNELIILDDFAANTVNNNARQVFAKVPGLNIWESDFAGLQLDIAARGLGPSRTANFNTRQNGYDMSADALGYPESYYMPSMQAIERIEIVRGAASLQYGTQFGGMLNFKIKEAPKKPFSMNFEQAISSFGLFNSFLSVGGTVNNVDYYSYYQYRTGDGWRPNSSFDSHLGFSRLGWQVNDRLKLGFEYSIQDYQAQQPGGLTDEDFENGSLDISRRNRNWFRVSWNLLASTLDYKVNEHMKLNVRGFGLFSGRDALGNLAQIDRIDDPDQNRTLISDDFQNVGLEARLLNYLNIFGRKSALLIGTRYYNGLTYRKQGDASASADPDFSFLNPENLEDFDYSFPSRNVSFFAENLLNITHRLSITPGLRFEHIQTDAIGTWKQTVRDFAGNIEAENIYNDEKSVGRSFILLGLGTSYYLNENLNLYANYSENFRSVTFSDLRLNNPNFVLDSLITDESGFNVDLGVRGLLTHWLNADISLFYLRYNDRIGVLLPAGSSLLFRTNIGDSRHFGLESFFEADLLKLLDSSGSQTGLSLFTNLSVIDAVYFRSDDSAIRGNEVEYVPNLMIRSGLNMSWKDFKATFQISYLSEQFSDATNSIFNPSALTGIIPSYNVMDFSIQYEPNRFKVTAGVNNLSDEQYFTRRAESYPGPGIIPATPRSFYFSFGFKL
jgi:Fe(3+) dicitrate transport protein